MATSKDILTLNKSKSILQRIGAMWSSIYCGKSKDKLNLHNHYKGYGKDKLVDKILETSYNIINSKSDYVGVVNDFGLEVITRLISEGYTNVVLLCTETNDELYTVIKFMLKREFNFDNIIRLDENMTDNFDLVIANPPYELGNEVIMETMKHCDNAVVLMPSSKYRKNRLFRHINTFEVLPWKDYHDCFADADTHIHLATLHKDCEVFKTYARLEQETYDPLWKKFLVENSKRVATWKYVDGPKEKLPKEFQPNIFYLTIRTMVDGVHKTQNCADYQMNYNHINTYTAEIAGAIFNTSAERDNMCEFWYHSKIMTPICRGINKQGGSGAVPLFLPRVDWTRPWTDEEILRDYEYTEDEVEEILNFEN